MNKEIYSSSDSTFSGPIAEKSSLREEALLKLDLDKSLDSSLSAASSRRGSSQLYDTSSPCRAIFITQPFAESQYQTSKSFTSLVYRFFMERPIAPRRMTTRLYVKFTLILVSIIDLLCFHSFPLSHPGVLTLDINMYCTDFHRTSTCSPIAVVVSMLLSLPCFASHSQIPLYDHFSPAYHLCYVDYQLLQSSLSRPVLVVDVGSRGFVHAFLRGVDALCGENRAFDFVFAGFEVCGVQSRSAAEVQYSYCNA